MVNLNANNFLKIWSVEVKLKIISLVNIINNSPGILNINSRFISK